MGTSSIYGGPSDKNPLLPQGFEDDYLSDDMDNHDPDNETENGKNKPDEEENHEGPLKGSWKGTKKAMSQFITGTSSNKGRIASNYVKASGGSKVASSKAVSGRGTTIQLGKFLSSIVRDGIYKTLESLQINYIGKNVETLLSEIVNLISPNSSTKEDAAARNALIEVECKMYEFIVENEMDIKSLDNMNEVMFDEIMGSYVTAYIFEKMLNDLQSRFEKYGDDTQVTLQKEKEFRQFIQISVELKLKDAKLSKLDYQDKSIDRIVRELYAECYSILEVY